MARTYIPSQVKQVHEMAKFLNRYHSPLRAAIVAVDPAYGALFDTLLSAVTAMDAVSAALYPLEP